MSTTAGITIKDRFDTFYIYCHGDGDMIGKMLKDICIESAKMDSNNHKNYDENYKIWAPNASIEAKKFVAVLLGMLWEKGYTGAYLETEELSGNYNYLVRLKDEKIPEVIEQDE